MFGQGITICTRPRENFGNQKLNQRNSQVINVMATFTKLYIQQAMDGYKTVRFNMVSDACFAKSTTQTKTPSLFMRALLPLQEFQFKFNHA